VWLASKPRLTYQGWISDGFVEFCERRRQEAEGLDLQVDGDKVRFAGVGAVSPSIREKIILAVGNMTGIDAVETDEDDGLAPVFYTVEKGDKLWAFAENAMGNGLKYTEIYEANKPMLSHPDKIYPDQVLRIRQEGVEA